MKSIHPNDKDENEVSSIEQSSTALDKEKEIQDHPYLDGQYSMDAIWVVIALIISAALYGALKEIFW